MRRLSAEYKRSFQSDSQGMGSVFGAAMSWVPGVPDSASVSVTPGAACSEAAGDDVPAIVTSRSAPLTSVTFLFSTVSPRAPTARATARHRLRRERHSGRLLY